MEGSLVINWNFDQKRRSVIINAKESDIYQSPRIALTARQVNLLRVVL